MKKLLIILVLSLAVCSSYTYSQKNIAEGKKFWGLFYNANMPVSYYHSFKLISKINTSIDISNETIVDYYYPEGFGTRMEITPDSSYSFFCPLSSFEVVAYDKIKKNESGFLFESDKDFTLNYFRDHPSKYVCHNYYDNMILPENELGNEYFLISPYTDKADLMFSKDHHINFYIISTSDNNIIDIHVMGKRDNLVCEDSIYTITLKKGELYKYTSFDDEVNLIREIKYDLTGTRIKTRDKNKKIAVFAIGIYGGYDTSFVETAPVFEPGQRLEMYNFIPVLPKKLLGREYLYLPQPNNIIPEYLFILATENNTKIKIGKDREITLNMSERYDSLYTSPTVIKADKPIYILKYYVHSQVGDENAYSESGNGDKYYARAIRPGIRQLIPVERMMADDVYFDSHPTIYEDESKMVSYLRVFTRTEDIGDFTLNELSFSGEFKQFPDFPEYSYLVKRIAKGMFTIDSDRPYLANMFCYIEHNKKGLGYVYQITYDFNLGIGGHFLNIDCEKDTICVGEEIIFNADYDPMDLEDSGITYLEWDYGDGKKNSGAHARHSYTEAGTYLVTLLGRENVSSEGIWDKVEMEIVVLPLPKPEIIAEKDTLCKDEEISLSLTEDYDFYSWSTGARSKDIKINKGGAYSVMVEDSNGCEASAEIIIYEFPELNPAIVIVGNDPFCEGDTVILKTEKQYNTYEWSNGETTETIKINKAGWYSVKVSDKHGCEAETKRMFINTISKPSPDINGKQDVCVNNESTYSIEKQSGSDVFWTVDNGVLLSGQGTEIINVLWSNTGLGTVKVKEENTEYCFGEDEIQVTIAESLHPEISKSHDVLCSGSEIVLSTTIIYDTYLWSSGETTKEITVSEAGNYWVRVADENGCEGVSDTIEIIEAENPTPIIIQEGILCEGGSTNLYTKNEYEGYLWNTGETTREITINNAGNYSIIVTDKNGCEGTTNIDISEFIIELAGLQDIDFDIIDIGKSDEKTLVLTNNSKKDIGINRVFFEESNQAIFELETIPVTPLIIKEKETLDIRITFAPEDTIEYIENVIVEITNPCETTKSFEVRGKGYSIVQEGYEVTVWLPDTTAVIGTKDYKIPLKAKISKDNIILDIASYEAEIEYYADGYLPEGIAHAIFIDNEIQDTMRYIKLSGSNTTISGETILAELSGTVLLSELLEVPLYLKSFSWSSNIPIETNDGKLILTGVCVQPIRLVQPIDGFSVAIIPNPAQDEANISIISPVENTPVYKIFTVEGVQIDTGKIATQKQNNSFTGTTTLDLTNYHSGIYLLTVQVQNIIVFEKVVVVK
jgi:hypothetical protein